MNLKNIAIAASIAASTVVAAGSAQAVQLQGGISFNLSGGSTVTVAPGAAVASANAVALGTGINQVSDTAGSFDPAVPLNSSVVIAPLTVDVTSGTTPKLSFSIVGFAPGTTPAPRFEFTPSSINTPVRDFINKALSVSYSGTIVDLTSVFEPTPGLVSLSFTQTGGPGTIISGSGTLVAIPEAVGVPETQPLSLLGIVAVLGLGAISKGKLARK